jgi:uncharacterized protein
VKLFGINIVGLSFAKHEFDFDLGSGFFKQYGIDVVSEGSLQAQLELDKHETFLEVTFKIKGTLQLTCDRSLEDFAFPLNINEKLMYKYGDEDREISEDVLMIHRDTATLDVGQPMYEFIVLAVPMKKLHPRFQDEEENGEDVEGKLVYSSSSETPEDDSPVDPRWEALKKLKK